MASAHAEGDNSIDTADLSELDALPCENPDLYTDRGAVYGRVTDSGGKSRSTPTSVNRIEFPGPEFSTLQKSLSQTLQHGLGCSDIQWLQA